MCTLNTQPPLFITPKPFHSVRLHSGFLSNLHFGPRQKLAPLGLQVVLRASPFPPCLRKKVQRILESSSSSPQTQILLGDRLPSRKCKVCVWGGLLASAASQTTEMGNSYVYWTDDSKQSPRISAGRGWVEIPRSGLREKYCTNFFYFLETKNLKHRLLNLSVIYKVST